MSIFNRLFTEFFKQKTKDCFLWLVLQFILSLGMAFFSVGHFFINPKQAEDFLASLFVIFSGLSVLVAIIFYIVTCVKNELINNNQTWRLVPIKDSLLYADNTLSSFIAVVYFAILEFLADFLLFGATFLFSNQFHAETLRNIAEFLRSLHNMDINTIALFLEAILVVVLNAFLIYFLISFFNFSSSALLDFLPGTSSKKIMAVIRFIIIMILAWLLSKVNQILRALFINMINMRFSSSYDALHGLIIMILTLLVIDLIFFSINIFLMSRYFEAKEKK